MAEPARGDFRLFTIGFTQKSAEQFFTTLIDAGVRRVVDVRLNNVSQLAGFTKRADLPFFLRRIGDIGYVHQPELAPTQEILDALKKQRGDWSDYERAFAALLADRQIAATVAPDLRDGDCLLCSEATPEQCHRRLVAEYLRDHWRGIEIRHL
jgi:uncharacterized protein (DUF488 family)